MAVQAALPPGRLAQFCRRLHLKLAWQVAERLCRRQLLVHSSNSLSSRHGAPPVTGVPRLSGRPRPCPLPAERQWSPRALRDLEVQRRAVQPAINSGASSSSTTLTAHLRAPTAGKQRAGWLRTRLVEMLRVDTVVCAALEGSTAEVLLACFEQLT